MSAAASLARDRIAAACAALIAVIVLLCLLAPVYAHEVAHTGPNENHITEQVKVGARTLDVVSTKGVPIGPTWSGRFLLGADANGRDVAVRLLYGGRNSLQIAALATLITMLLAVTFGTLAGYLGGVTDALISRLLDLVWAFPAILLAVALGVAFAVGGVHLGPITLHGGSLGLPALVIGVVFFPYLARPLRAQTLSLREREFVDAARVLGSSPAAIVAREIIPNLSSTIASFVPLIFANAVLLEAGMSYLGAGVRDPNPSWGTMIGEGVRMIPGAIHVVLAPGIALVAVVLAINVLADAVRAELDPKALREVKP